MLYHYWNSDLFFSAEILSCSCPESKDRFDLLAGGIIPERTEEEAELLSLQPVKAWIWAS